MHPPQLRQQQQPYHPQQQRTLQHNQQRAPQLQQQAPQQQQPQAPQQQQPQAPQQPKQTQQNVLVVVIDQSSGIPEDEFRRLLRTYVVPLASRLSITKKAKPAKFYIVTYPDEASYMAGTKTITTLPDLTFEVFYKRMTQLRISGEGLYGVLGPALQQACALLPRDPLVS